MRRLGERRSIPGLSTRHLRPARGLYGSRKYLWEMVCTLVEQKLPVGSVSLVGRLNTLSWAVYSGDSTLSAHQRGRGTPVADSHILNENARTRASPSPWPPGHPGHLDLPGLSGQAHHSGLLSAWSPQPPRLTPATWADLENRPGSRFLTGMGGGTLGSPASDPSLSSASRPPQFAFTLLSLGRTTAEDAPACCPPGHCGAGGCPLRSELVTPTRAALCDEKSSICGPNSSAPRQRLRTAWDDKGRGAGRKSPWASPDGLPGASTKQEGTPARLASRAVSGGARRAARRAGEGLVRPLHAHRAQSLRVPS